MYRLKEYVTMIEYVELTVKLKVTGKSEPIDAHVRIQPGYPLYTEAGELALLEQEIGLSVDSLDGQCFKLCLAELFNIDCFFSLKDVLLAKLKEAEGTIRFTA